MTNASSTTRPKATSGGSTPSQGTTRTLHTERDAAGQVTSRVRRTVLPQRAADHHRAAGRRPLGRIGVWVGVGSRDESPALHGCSHFLEHLLFKGTPERSALDISVALDAVGGEFNAFTAKEYTCFHARVLDEDLPLAVDVLGDMITSSTLAPEDVEAERDVILDEIAMHDDDPDDVVHNLFATQAWGDSPARPRDRRHRGVDRGADPRPGPPLLPAPLPPGQHRRGRGRQRRPRRAGPPGQGGVRPQRLARRRGGAGRAAARRPQAGPARPDRGDPPVRAGQPGARHGGPAPRRRPSLRARRAQHRARRRYVEPALPGGARAPRPGVLRLLVLLPPRRLRPGRGLGRLPAQPARRRARGGPRGAGEGRRATASPPRSWPAARASCAADWCSDSRTRRPGCRASARPSWSTTSCSASTR